MVFYGYTLLFVNLFKTFMIILLLKKLIDTYEVLYILNKDEINKTNKLSITQQMFLVMTNLSTPKVFNDIKV